ncbi:hypothetical protein [Bartonella sp. TT67HLJMS]|uniref:hypothetical protein n=1 Tax=Bartonella sp. TT67HLJMS TaxID=3243582 RepID=UPI0035CF0491
MVLITGRIISQMEPLQYSPWLCAKTWKHVRTSFSLIENQATIQIAQKRIVEEWVTQNKSMY